MHYLINVIHLSQGEMSPLLTAVSM